MTDASHLSMTSHGQWCKLWRALCSQWSLYWCQQVVRLTSRQSLHYKGCPDNGDTTTSAIDRVCRFSVPSVRTCCPVTHLGGGAGQTAVLKWLISSFSSDSLSSVFLCWLIKCHCVHGQSTCNVCGANFCQPKKSHRERRVEGTITIIARQWKHDLNL